MSGKRKVEKFGNVSISKLEKEYLDFDSVSNDVRFIIDAEIEREYIYDDPNDNDSDRYERPKNMQEARVWIKSNVHRQNQKKLLNAIDDMEKDYKIWFYVAV